MNFYDRAGRPITAQQWFEATQQNRTLAYDQYDTSVRTVVIETVWTGTDHNTPPLIFATAVKGFDPSGDLVFRHATQAEALAAHVELGGLFEATHRKRDQTVSDGTDRTPR